MGSQLNLRRASRGLLLALALMGGTVQAAVPHLVRYQGQAVDSQGVPLQGPYTLTFRLYDADTAGTIVWQEQQANVPINKGHFSVLLGQVTALTVDWNQSLWLSIQVGADPELLPRQRITSVPLAIRSEVAEGLVTQITTSTITDDANKLVPSGAIILWSGANCPAGYTRLSALDGKFLVGGASYTAAAGGSNAHTHGAGSYLGPSHVHSIDHTHTVGQTPENGAPGYIWPKDKYFTTSGPSPVTSGPGGANAITGISSPADSRPEFATILLCQRS